MDPLQIYFPIEHRDFPASYVSLLEGIDIFGWKKLLSWMLPAKLKPLLSIRNTPGWSIPARFQGVERFLNPGYEKTLEGDKFMLLLVGVSPFKKTGFCC